MHALMRGAHRELLATVLAEADLRDYEREAFLAWALRGLPLSDKQEAWLLRVATSNGLGGLELDGLPTPKPRDFGPKVLRPPSR